MAVQPERQTFVFTLDAVRRGVAALSARPIHEHFPGYLAVLRARRESVGEPASMSDISDFHDRYLKAPGHPEASPFVRPFKSRGRGFEAFNANVAGSYAPSSLRSKGRIIEVIAVEGSRSTATYDLQKGHADAALEHLLMNRPVPVVALASFLYRDYGLLLSGPKVSSVVSIFRNEFGLRSSVREEGETFDTLFEDDSDEFASSDFELLAPVKG